MAARRPCCVAPKAGSKRSVRVICVSFAVSTACPLTLRSGRFNPRPRGNSPIRSDPREVGHRTCRLGRTTPSSRCGARDAVDAGHQKLNSRVSAIVQTNANGRMTLKFVKYLYRSALKCSLAQLRRKMPGILFLNSTRRNQRANADNSYLVRFRVGA